MKHIKPYGKFTDVQYQLFENIDLHETLNDILLPIGDMGYDISVTEDDHFQVIIGVVKFDDKPLLITDSVKEEFMRMKDYLESEGYASITVLHQLATPGNISSTDVKEFDDFMKFESWQKVKIQMLLFVAKKEL